MAEEINARIRHVGKTQAQWLTDDTVLLEGELGYATDTQVIKVGNGKDVWRDLKSHQGEKGDKGDPLRFEDLTQDQIDEIKAVDIDLSNYSQVGHGHVISDVSDLQNALNGKANTSHTHSEYARKEEVPKIEQVTQSEYDRLGSKDSNTLYVVVG